MPLISVQIVTWNSAEVLDACLHALTLQVSRAFEVIVVDNASTDGSADRATAWADRLPHLTVIRETVNRGFCGGQNRATACAAASWSLFLNPDAELSPSFIASACAAIASAPTRVGAIAPCILLPDGLIDSTGLTMDRFRRAYDRDRGASADRRMLAERNVLGCTGAVALLRRAMLDDVAVEREYLDERIFAYYDDLDLAWRAAWRGWTCLYEPSLSAVHRRAARNAIRALPGREPRARDQVLSVRNRLLVMARCERLAAFVLALPWLLPFEVARLGYLTWRAPHALVAYWELLRELGPALTARPAIVGRRVLPSLPPLPWRAR